jgi:hypothetical protein
MAHRAKQEQKAPFQMSEAILPFVTGRWQRNCNQIIL